MLKTVTSDAEPLVSVVIPAFNCNGYIGCCIKSILCQSHPNLEVLLVDDGSTDSTLQVAKEYADFDKRVRVFHQQNRGPSAARNLALRHASGDFITFVDADDFIDPEYVEVLLSLSLDHGADMASCGYDTMRLGQEAVRGDEFGLELFGPNSSNLSEVHYPYTVWHVMFKRGLIEDIQFDEKVYYLEDLKFIDQAFMRCDLVASVSSPLYHRISHSSSFTESRFTVGGFEKYKTLIDSLYSMIAITEECPSLCRQRIMSVIKESAILLELMSHLGLEDEAFRAKTVSYARYAKEKLKAYKPDIKERVIAWLCLHVPFVYRKMKHIDFSNGTI